MDGQTQLPRMAASGASPSPNGGGSGSGSGAGAAGPSPQSGAAAATQQQPQPPPRLGVSAEPDRHAKAAAARAAGSMHHGQSFGAYMELKQLKQREQFERRALEAGPARSAIFAGVVAHVNGRTAPSADEIKQIMALHGGAYEVYFSRDAVTHFICGHLPDTKIKQLSSHPRKPVAIVRPEWVVASLRAGRQLPVRRGGERGFFPVRRWCGLARV